MALCVALAVSSRVLAQVSFTKITNGAIVTDTGGFSVCAWADFSNSGFLDLLVCNNGNIDPSTPGTNVFYHNNGDGTFTNVTQGALVADGDYHVAAAVGDYDNDGKLDLVIASGVNSPSPRRSFLFHNNGGGVFTRAGNAALTNITGYFANSVWADLDNDGFLDLSIGESSSGKILLFHNQGDGTFSRINSGSVLTDVSYGNPVWADYDNDGFDDLLVSTGINGGVNLLYHNNRNGTFTRISTNTIGTDLWPSATACAAWGDYDNDGLQDLFVTSPSGAPNRLYHNNGDGSFKSISTGPQASRPENSASEECAWGDYDNDGYLDLFVASYNGPNMIFHNNGDGTFSQVLSGAPVSEDNSGLYCNSCSWVDYDNDGFLDLFVTRAPGASNLLYHNDGNTNAWLEVKLVGTVANRSAIGAKVRVHATVGGKSFWQMREISNGSGRWAPPLVAHFGLGDATNVDALRVEWPSGTTQEISNVAARQILTITEPSRLTAAMTNGIPQLSFKGLLGSEYDIQTSSNLSVWFPLETLTITNAIGTMQVLDTNAPVAAARFYRAESH